MSFGRWFDANIDGCWPWTGALDRDGYGVFCYIGKVYKAHSMALRLDGRPVPKGMYACHHCDNPSCVNPAHLYVGTPLENSRDAKDRGRVPVGEKHYLAKLTEKDVLEIRASDLTCAKLAMQFGVSLSNISFIRTGKSWRHVV